MEKKKERSLLSIIVTGIVSVTLFSDLLLVPYASAQEEKAQQEVYELDKVTVTAQKQEENLQEVSMSVTALDELAIQDMKVESVVDIADFIPNFMVFSLGNGAQNLPVMRGISAPQENFSTSTALFVDGMPILSTNGYEAGMINVERIEILRGPQGTLYGRGAETGVINIITKQPGDEFEGYVSVDAGQWLSSESGDKMTGKVALSLNGPIIKDNLFFSLAGKYEHKDGFIENTVSGESANDQSKWLGEAKLRWIPTADLDISFKFSRMEISENGSLMHFSAAGAARYIAWGLPISIPQDRKVSPNIDEFAESIINTHSLKVTYDFSDALTLTSITSNWHYTINSLFDIDSNPITLAHSNNDFDYKKNSQELRLAYTGKNRLKWLLGVYYDRDDNDFHNQVFSDYGMGGEYDRNYYGDAYAVFTNLTYPLFDKFSLVGGLRYEKEDRNFTDRNTNVEMDGYWDDISPKLALNYKVTSDIMTYVSAAKGYRSGGFNAIATDPEFYTYNPEELWSYEIGSKMAFMNNRLILNWAVFYMDISDMQVTEALPTGYSYLTNAAEATGKGVELELTARITNTLSLMGGFGYTDIEFDSFSDIQGDYEGNKNPWAPDYTFNIGAQYRHVAGFFARADLIGYGKMYFDKTNTAYRDPYKIVNVKIGYEGEPIDVYVYGKNIFDERYDAKDLYDGSWDIYSQPGEVGLQIVYRF